MLWLHGCHEVVQNRGVYVQRVVRSYKMSLSKGKLAADGKLRKPEPAEIVYKNMRFLITYRPTDATMDKFIEELKRHNVKDVVCVCERTYDQSKLNEQGIQVVDLEFEDGSPPPTTVVDDWFELLKTRLCDDPTACIAVHCVSGLGRAPVLVALALIELGMKYEDAVEMIREGASVPSCPNVWAPIAGIKKRRGAINAKQLSYLEKYHSKSRLKKNGQKSCNLM